MRNKTVENVKSEIAFLPSWKKVYIEMLYRILVGVENLMAKALPKFATSDEHRWMILWQAGKHLSFAGYTGSDEGMAAYETEYKARMYKEDGSRPWTLFKISMAQINGGIFSGGMYEEGK